MLHFSSELAFKGFGNLEVKQVLAVAANDRAGGLRRGPRRPGRRSRRRGRRRPAGSSALSSCSEKAWSSKYYLCAIHRIGAASWWGAANKTPQELPAAGKLGQDSARRKTKPQAMVRLRLKNQRADLLNSRRTETLSIPHLRGCGAGACSIFLSSVRLLS